MRFLTKDGFKADLSLKRTAGASIRRFLTVGGFLAVAAVVILPASIAGAQSAGLEGVDALYQSYAMTTANSEERLSGDFLDTLVRLDAGVLELDTVTGAFAEEASGTPAGEGGGLYASVFSGSITVDPLPTGYDSDISGWAAGYERWLRNTLIALNFSSTESDVDFDGGGFGGMSENQKMQSGAVHAMGTYYGNWTWRGRIGGFMTDHEFDAGDGSDIVTYETSGVNAGAMIGYRFRLGETWGTILPEVGGSYLYTERESLTVDDQSTNYFHDNQVSGAADLRWATYVNLMGIDMAPSIAAGVQKLLTEEMIGETWVMDGTSTRYVNEQETMTRTLSASLLVHLPLNLKATLAYDGVFGDEVSGSLLSLRCQFSF